MTTIIINEQTDEGRMLMSMIRAAQKSSAAVISIHDDDATGHIPGLTYTLQERRAAIRRAMADIKAGNVHSSEDVRAMFPGL